MSRKTVAISAVTLTLAASLILKNTTYKVTQVIDGDTFRVSTGQRIRFDSVNAPEINYCLGEESKKALENLILNKKVFIKVNYIDSYKRLVSEVYTLNGNVGSKMLEKGMATFLNKGRLSSSEYLASSNKARDKKLGVFSEKCTQTSNPINPKCNIKGNVRDETSFYHRPDCGQYNNSVVQLYLGDQWFCTEKEAFKAGFTKGGDCK